MRKPAKAQLQRPSTLHQAMVHENERSGAAWTLEWLTLPKVVLTTGASLRLGLQLIQQMQVAPTRWRRAPNYLRSDSGSGRPAR